MMATFMAPRSTQSTKSWIPAVPAFLTSTLRLVAGKRLNKSLFCLSLSFGCDTFSVQALKVLKTAEFMPFVVFIAAPELDTLRAMHKAVVDAGLTTKLLTVSFERI